MPLKRRGDYPMTTTKGSAVADRPSDTSAPVVAPPKRQLAARTNRPFSLPGVDLRTAQGRRYTDIVRSLRMKYGDSNPAGINELAATQLALERMQAAIVKGDAVDTNDLVRLSNLAVRQEARLAGKSPKKAVSEAKKPGKPLTLRDYAAAKKAAKKVARQ